ncbi:hypothetical protein BU23DRAFT_300127 [Bimuria novae-zelandiae CBS 107.79]|uniref:Uncharacterized protein n=1 Tax=Bimuria novae-zelandiae CBS 107.79 TaxID=1447943 RepID=A0A6A5VK43_9PLEO|nr:hypothetical protein BU23DRAFT_300127 [Bimuria novae-zelandiae CBS 107.79]
MKLLFDTTSQGASVRDALQEVMQPLYDDETIAVPFHAVRDFLICIFNHCKQQLAYQGYIKSSTAAFGIPVCWKLPFIHAHMEDCMKEAMLHTEFGITNGVQSPALFFVNEAEASAIYALDKVDLYFRHDEVVLLIDCSGGTADAILFQVGNENPFRMTKIIGEPKGILVGGCDINDRLFEFVMREISKNRSCFFSIARPSQRSSRIMS